MRARKLISWLGMGCSFQFVKHYPRRSLLVPWLILSSSSCGAMYVTPIFLQDCGYGEGGDAHCTACPPRRYKSSWGHQRCQICITCAVINRIQKANCTATSNAVCGDCLPRWAHCMKPDSSRPSLALGGLSQPNLSEPSWSILSVHIIMRRNSSQGETVSSQASPLKFLAHSQPQMSVNSCIFMSECLAQAQR